ncbi:hypothetical protein BS17DRAFT_418063 [Gyrodon lividus]|nr:hypothetical protein BS17DRAFT_418063 [Gyrodon lividus]
MPFPFALFRALVLCMLMMPCGLFWSSSLTHFLLAVIVACNITSTVLPIIAFHARTAGSFEILAIILSLLSLLIITGCLWHQFANQDEEASNTRNVGMFGSVWLLGVVLAVSLTFHARQDGVVALCNNFVHAQNPCMLANVQLAMAYIPATFALTGFVISWMDKLPGVVKVTPRYAITKAPSSHFAAHSHPLDDETKYTPYPSKASSKRSKESMTSRYEEWSDIPV